MSKKNNAEIQSSGGFSDRPLRKRKTVETPVEEAPVAEPTAVEEPVAAPEEYSYAEPVPHNDNHKDSDGAPQVEYDDYKEPLGSKKENGIILTIILSSLLIVSLLGFLIYYEHSWRLHEEQENVLVDSRYEELSIIVKNYVSTIDDPNKGELCQKLESVYREAAKSTDDIDTVLKKVQEQSQDILGFNERVARTKEYEWYKLLGVHGVIDNWVTESGLGFTKQNQKELFTAIAEGFK